jgi:hypothetical protein
MKEKRVCSALCFGLLLWLGCFTAKVEQTANGQTKDQKAPVSNPSPRPYSKDLNELRARFNQDKGKVRLLVLLSPT